MKAEYKNEIDRYRAGSLKGFKTLKDLLPLETPFSIYIDPTNVCNFRCAFCPTGDVALLRQFNRPKGFMPLDLFCKIIDDISEFEQMLKALWLVKDGEPLIHKDIKNMIGYAKRKGVAEVIKLTTNGSLLDKKRGIEIIDAGLDYIKISVEHVNDLGYKKITKTFSDYNRIKRNVETLFEEKEKRNSELEIHVKILDVDLTDQEKEKFVRDFKNISDSINIDTLMGWSNSDKKDFTMGKTIEHGMTHAVLLKKDRVVCPEPFKTLSVNFDGSTSVCCVDWSHNTIVGDVRKESLYRIWNGNALNTFRLMHLEGNRDRNQCCANCHFILGIPMVSDIDNVRSELLGI